MSFTTTAPGPHTRAPATTAESISLSESRELGQVVPHKLPDGTSISNVRTSPLGRSWAHFIGGALGGMTAATLTNPLDVLKTRLQSDFYQSQIASLRTARNIPAPESLGLLRGSALHIRETFQILYAIPRAEGARALFKGLGPNLVGVVPARAINFFVYGNSKRFLSYEFNDGKEGPLIHMSSAAIAGIVTGTATNPIWLVKTRLQLDKTHSQQGAQVRQYKNALDCAIKTVRYEGVRGLYRGLTASYLGVTESTLQWMTYEQMKTWLGCRDDQNEASAGNNQLWNDTSRWGRKLFAAGTAKFFAAIITYPHEVVRTRLRQAPLADGRLKYTGLMQCFRLIWREEGMVGLYGGLVPHMFRAVPNAIIMFGVYEATLRAFGTTSEI